MTTDNQNILWEEKNLIDQPKNSSENVENVNCDTTTETKKDLTNYEQLDISKIKSGIYKIINKLNGKYYIGSSKDINLRFKQHISRLQLNKHSNCHLQRAWNIYGKENFEFIIIEKVFIENLLIKEQHHFNNIKNRDECYNISLHADKPEMNEETRNKISATLMGRKQRPMSDETKRRLSIAKTGKPRIVKNKEENRKRIKETVRLWMSKLSKEERCKKFGYLKGMTISNSTKEKISKSLKLRLKNNPILMEEAKILAITRLNNPQTLQKRKEFWKELKNDTVKYNERCKEISESVKKGWKHRNRFTSDDTRKKISEASKLNWQTMISWNRDETIYKFSNLKTNENFIGLKSKFIKKYNLIKGSVYYLIKGIAKTHKGWVFSGIQSNSVTNNGSEPVSLTNQISVI